MIKFINISALVLSCAISLHAMESKVPSDQGFPKTWQELVGKENVGMFFVGNSLVHNKLEIYVANITGDMSLFETIEKPDAPDKFQKYQLTTDGLLYNLQFKKDIQIEGILEKYEHQETKDEITWTFRGIHKEKEVVHQFKIKKYTGAIKISTDIGGHRHAEVELAPMSKITFYYNHMRDAVANTIFGK